MRLTGTIFLALVLAVAGGAAAYEVEEFLMRDDFGTEPLSDCQLNYYYYTPCPTYSWFWAFTGWVPGDVVGCMFTVGDLSMSTGQACDPVQCHTLERIRVLDFAGYGTCHPGLFTVDFKVHCSDEYGCPVGPALWESGPYETGFAWNYVVLDPPLSICDCLVSPGVPMSTPRILVTATHIGYYGFYPAWGFDNIWRAYAENCESHELSCLPVLYPRPYNSYYATIHTGYYGPNYQYCPPLWFQDAQDTTPDASLYGYIELAWRIYLDCSGPTGVEPTTWGHIKGMYR